MDFKEFGEKIVEWCQDVGIKILIALVIMIISFKILNYIKKRLIKRITNLQRVDYTIASTICNSGTVVLKMVIVFCLVEFVGVSTSSITALIASMGVGIGLAVNGALSNIAGGLLLLFSRPFKVGDYIEINDYLGYVEEIRLVDTKICTKENKVIYIPNSVASSSTVINHLERKYRRSNLEFDIAYSSDIGKVREVVMSVLNAHESVIKDNPEYKNEVVVLSHDDSAVRICIRVWTESSIHWDVGCELREKLKVAFDNNGIEIPFPQMDVHIKDK